MHNEVDQTPCSHCLQVLRVNSVMCAVAMMPILVAPTSYDITSRHQSVHAPSAQAPRHAQKAARERLRADVTGPDAALDLATSGAEAPADASRASELARAAACMAQAGSSVKGSQALQGLQELDAVVQKLPDVRFPGAHEGMPRLHSCQTSRRGMAPASSSLQILATGDGVKCRAAVRPSPASSTTASHSATAT